MAQNTPNTQQEEAFIPPSYMLILAGIGLLVAIIVFLTQPNFSVVGWGGLGIMVLSLFAWVLMSPQQARDFLTGRSLRFGGTSLIVTIVLLVALVAIYTFVRGQNIQLDLTQSYEYTLAPESREVVLGMGVDPNIPNIKLFAFYTADLGAQRDQDSLLFEDYQRTSNGKITFEFIDPDRDPITAQQYKAERGGRQVAVVAFNDDGTPNVDGSQLVSFVGPSSQVNLTNAILTVAASGDFRAYFLNVQDGLEISDTGDTGMSNLRDYLSDTLKWTTSQISILQFMGSESTLKLNDPTTDGTVVVIPGGSSPLTDDELKVLTDYLDQGGDLVILAAPTFTAEDTSLAMGEKLQEYLYNNFGIRFVQDVVIDLSSSGASPLSPVSVDFSRNNFITQSFPTGFPMVFDFARSIEVSPSLPANVTVDELARSGANAYAKTYIDVGEDNTLDQSDIAKTDTDTTGPFVLAAAAQNTTTGARVVLFGSTSPIYNGYTQSNTGNWIAARNSLIWATNFTDFFAKVDFQQDQTRPQDQPIFATQETQRTIYLVTIFLLPFGVLLIGFLVWWNSREPAR